ncbi:amidase [Paraburkholderia sp. RL17-337-BIB-A]|uniref:amidase n=1 Tax=Paraburkholderia sp. RL17-337-BIB-A TaxID=3031636 RepID=UPI0038BD3409
MLYTSDLASLSQSIHSGSVSPVEVLDAYLERIIKLDSKLHAYTEVFEADARAAAKAAAKMISAGYSLGPLHGIPIAIKDLIDIEGKVTTGGSPLFADHIASSTADVARRLVRAGAVLIGKTHMVQVALGAWGTNEHMGTPWNPWDMKTHRVPGGSSSGSAVAVAARMAPFALGTDTGGSIRVPAGFCGITGLKPTVGKISAKGLLPLSRTLDSVGILSVSAADAALLYDGLTSPNGCVAVTAHQRGKQRLTGLRGYRIARLAENDFGNVERDVRAAYEASLEVLASLGAEIVTMKMPCDFDDFASMASAIMLAEAAAEYGTQAQDMALRVDSSVRPRLLKGKTIPATEYIKALRLRDHWKRVFLASMDGIDAILTPTTLSTAIPVSEVNHDTPPVRYTRVVNLLELCGLALPSGFDAKGLPCSIQVICRGDDEDTALQIGMAYQTATDWHTRMPQV